MIGDKQQHNPWELNSYKALLLLGFGMLDHGSFHTCCALSCHWYPTNKQSFSQAVSGWTRPTQPVPGKGRMGDGKLHSAAASIPKWEGKKYPEGAAGQMQQ